jgi:hypothetical protein
MPRKPPTFEPVSVQELTTPVRISTFASWVEELCARYADDPKWQHYFSEKRGLAKDLQDELIPLGVFCRHVADRYVGASLRYFHGSNQSFDAKIILANGEEGETIEVTTACNGYQDAIASESAVLHGFAPLYSNIHHSGKRTGRQLLEPELVSLDANAIVDECIEQVRNAVEQKSNSGKYVGAHLLVAFDDFRFLYVAHIERAMEEFRAIKSSFPVVYFVGLGGRLYVQSGAAKQRHQRGQA